MDHRLSPELEELRRTVEELPECARPVGLVGVEPQRLAAGDLGHGLDRRGVRVQIAADLDLVRRIVRRLERVFAHRVLIADSDRRAERDLVVHLPAEQGVHRDAGELAGRVVHRDVHGGAGEREAVRHCGAEALGGALVVS